MGRPRLSTEELCRRGSWRARARQTRERRVAALAGVIWTAIEDHIRSLTPPSLSQGELAEVFDAVWNEHCDDEQDAEPDIGDGPEYQTARDA